MKVLAHKIQRSEPHDSVASLAWKVLAHKIQRSEPHDSVASLAWKATLQKYEADHAQLLTELVPIRKDTMQLLAPDWRYSRRYSDLPGAVNWRKEWVRALDERVWRPVRAQ
ncbi:unnamed protein product [Prorocentrum cordatum]|uniref:Uncharacterized protein n=1 Tax=Prorocentrum cordatum TaxID=2364126 RepID=A0ABN9XBN9_9DINO|nr:unnamed protein product [Polarella glacialis]